MSNKILKCLYYLKYKFNSIDNCQWFFTSYGGKYTDNTKALSETIHLLFPNIRIVWAVNNDIKRELPQYVKYVKYDSGDYFKEKSKSIVIIDNVFCEMAEPLCSGEYLGNTKKRIKLWLTRKNQKCYSLWHGAPIKCMGRDQFGNDNIVDFIFNNLVIITGDTYTAEILHHISFNKIDCIPLGMPRNDTLIFPKISVEKLKEQLKLPKNKRIVLFAPTFRNDGKNTEGLNVKRSGIMQLDSINIEDMLSALSFKFGEEWALICRFHYHVSELIDWSELSRKYNGKVINGNLSDDMSDYLQCADILLTDYSSAMFDFALTGKPCFLFTPDLSQYLNKERGLYVSIDSLPFPYSENSDNLISIINRFDEEKYNTELSMFLKKMGNANDGKACMRVAEFIYNDQSFCQ